MAYFNQLPKTKFLNQDIVNLAVGVKLNKLIKSERQLGIMWYLVYLFG